MTEPLKKSRAIKPSHIVAVFLALGVTAWIGSGVVKGNVPEPAEEPTTATKEAPLPYVRVMQSVAQLQEREVILFGRTEAIHRADIAAEISGRIVKKSKNKGDIVKKGEVLFQISMEDRMSQIAEAKAKLEYEEISYNAAKRLSKKQFQSQVKLAEVYASLETAKAALKAIQLEVSKTSIRAPIDGLINELPLSVGDYVKSGEIVAAVVDLNPLRIVAQVSERDISRIRKNAKAKAVLPDGRHLQGEVKFISQVGSSSTRTFDVDVWIENSETLSSEGQVPEGLTAELRLLTESERAHLVSPAVLTLDDEGAVGVKSVNDENVVVFHRVKIVADTPAGVWLGGLPELVTLISVGQEFVLPGQKVRTATEAEIKNRNVQKNPQVDEDENPS